MSSMHPAIQTGRTAVITGAASGIGLAASLRFTTAGFGEADLLMGIQIIAPVGGEMETGLRP